ncbi:hypothetical protein TgHK011_004194 [Trichoderma gracile]|nr:hypothetical protein TgHK011_004194 [Trichoderma gracile]
MLEAAILGSLPRRACPGTATRNLPRLRFQSSTALSPARADGDEIKDHPPRLMAPTAKRVPFDAPGLVSG